MRHNSFFFDINDIKIESADNAAGSGILPKPDWLKVRLRYSDEFFHTRQKIAKNSMRTVCEEARCPNIGECWHKGHATVMILGSICTRACAFCNVKTGIPEPVDHDEPKKIAALVESMNLKHVVITSVDRDDLPDGGAGHFAACVKYIRSVSPDVTIEVLTPDFIRKGDAYKVVLEAQPDVFNHNLETVARLYPRVKRGSRYFNSLNLLYRAKQHNASLFTKSGIIAGLGETDEELWQAMDDLRAAEVDFLTLGQYLQPSKNNIAVSRYVTPKQFETYKQIALAKGFLMVSSSPLTRSSHHAGEDFIKLRNAQKRNNAQPT